MEKMSMKLSFFLFLILAGLSVKGIDNDNPPPCHTLEITGTHVSCNGMNDGSATITISDISGDYSITWSTGETGVTSINNLSAGYYDVEVIDNLTGCSRIAIINITEPDPLLASLTSTAVDCNGDASGSLELSVNGGTEPYTYAWDNGESTADLQNVPAGTYSLTITDDNGCSTSLSGEVTEPFHALGSSIEHSEISCNDASDASVDVDVWGGTPFYTYAWSNGSSSQDLTNVPAGTYTVSITDNNGCSMTQSVDISNPPALSLTSYSTNNDCYGDTDGTAGVTVSGGTEPYTYNWANSDYMLSYNIPELENLIADDYFLTVTDAHGCSLTETFTVTSPDALEISISGTDATSYGASDGQIELDVEGGTPPYSYNWSNGVSSEDNPDVPAGEYSVDVIDNNGCQISASIVIEQPLSALEYTYTQENVNCNGGSDGAITLHATGGVKPYTYLWSNGSTLDYLTDLQAGTYFCTLTDANNTEFVDSIVITEPAPLSFSFSTTNISCFGGNDGIIDLTVSGGTEPYRYQWYDPDYALAGIQEDLHDVRAGEYQLEVTDTNNCRSEVSVSLTQPEPIQLSLSGSDIECHGASTGTITSQVSGGEPGYSYNWSNGNTDANPVNLPAGEYMLTVTDENGCEAFDDMTLYEPSQIKIELYSTPVSCEAQSDGTAEALVIGGSGAYEYNWNTGATDSEITDLTEGLYSLTVTDIFECEATDSVIVSKNDIDCISIPSSFTPNGDGYNDNWVIRNAYLFPECKLQVFNKWGNIVYETTGYNDPWDGKFQGEVLPSGTYYYIFKTTPESEEKTGNVTILK
ncbi:MAG: gliding motility-associated C-terminal domain-containing protein [Bacteroidales bacterium]